MKNPTYSQLEAEIIKRLKSHEDFVAIIQDVASRRKIHNLKSHLHKFVEKQLSHQMNQQGSHFLQNISKKQAANLAKLWIEQIRTNPLLPKLLFDVKLQLAIDYGQVVKGVFLPPKSVRNISNADYADFLAKLIADTLTQQEITTIMIAADHYRRASIYNNTLHHMRPNILFDDDGDDLDGDFENPNW